MGFGVCVCDLTAFVVAGLWGVISHPDSCLLAPVSLSSVRGSKYLLMAGGSMKPLFFPSLLLCCNVFEPLASSRTQRR